MQRRTFKTLPKPFGTIIRELESGKIEWQMDDAICISDESFRQSQILEKENHKRWWKSQIQYMKDHPESIRCGELIMEIPNEQVK